MKKTFIIAEAGVNHNGSLELAIKLAEKAKEIGADCVKYQTFKAEQIVTSNSPKAQYQLKVTDSSESQFDMLKKLELKKEDFATIKNHCEKIGIEFMSTPYNPEDALLLNDLGVKGFKIASGQMVETPFLNYVASFGKQMIVSSGMCDMNEVRMGINSIRESGNNDIILLQCNTDYPSKIEDTNLLAMLTMKEELNVRVGYSDHVPNNYACFAAVALGAEVIEKHFTLDKSMSGPDHSSSLEPREFHELIFGIRQIEKAMGSGIKIPSENEKKNIFGMRRSLVASENIRAGTTIELKHLGFKRPASGILPKDIDLVIGKTLLHDINKDEAFLFGQHLAS
jgi:N,N'-diacetyllegionaminate synthase